MTDIQQLYSTNQSTIKISNSLSQYTEIFKNAIRKSTEKLNKSFETTVIETIFLYFTINKIINFNTLAKYDNKIKQTYRNIFKKKFDWFGFNLDLANQGLRLIVEKLSLLIQVFTKIQKNYTLYWFFLVWMCNANETWTKNNYQARDIRKLDFAFNTSFAAVNVAKVMIYKNQNTMSISQLKTLMNIAYIIQRFFVHLKLNQTSI